MKCALAGLALLALLAACNSPAPAPPPAGVLTISSVEVQLPPETLFFPDRPEAETVNANCTACHSASMTLTQPQLTPAQWEAVITKMQNVHKAPIASADVPAIVQYLVAFQADATVGATSDATSAGAARNR